MSVVERARAPGGERKGGWGKTRKLGRGLRHIDRIIYFFSQLKLSPTSSLNCPRSGGTEGEAEETPLPTAAAPAPDDERNTPRSSRAEKNRFLAEMGGRPSSGRPCCRFRRPVLLH